MLGQSRFVRRFRLLAIPSVAPALLASTLAGCNSFSPDAGMLGVNAVVAPQLGSAAVKVESNEAAAEAVARTRALLRSPLSAEAAVRIALLNNKGLQASYNELGIAEAVMVQASLPPSPTISLSRIVTPVELDIERRVVADILALATLPARAEIAAERFHQAQLRAAEKTLKLAAATRRRYYRAVAAVEIVAALDRAAGAAETTVKLARELGATGAMNKLDQARENAFRADVVTQLDMARQDAATARERLVRAMGLSDDNLGFKLPQSLPAMPKRPRALAAVETDAIGRRVDLQIARLEADSIAKSYGLTNATRFINLLEVAGVSRTQHETSGAQGSGGGGELDFQIPIFDFGEAHLREAGETYMQAVNRLSEKAANVRSEAREAYQAYRYRYDIAEHFRRDVLPLRKTVSDETMLRYGAMQIDVFALLSEARQRIAANIAAIGAQRDFWLANTELDAAISGGGVDDDDRAPAPAGSAESRTSE
jgi:outer membrane protein TolC